MGFFRRRRSSPQKAEPPSTGTSSNPSIGCRDQPRGEGATSVFEIDLSELTFRECDILDRSADLTDVEQKWYQSFEELLNRQQVNLSLVSGGSVDIMTQLNDPLCAMPKLAEAIALDPVLAGSVMGMANSPMFRGSVEVTDLSQATVRLGQKQLKLVLMTALMNSALVKGKPFEDFSLLSWKHSLFVARLCRSLAKPAGLKPDVGYMAGLFHNVGKIAILSGTRYVNDKSKNKVTPRTLLQLLHVHGYSINARTIGEWNLSAEIVDAVKHYRARPGSRYGGPYAVLVGLADAVSHKFGIWAEVKEFDLEAHPALEALSMGPHHLPSLEELNRQAEEIDQTAAGAV
jgi:HD-like signal output (HDOD) protein